MESLAEIEVTEKGNDRRTTAGRQESSPGVRGAASFNRGMPINDNASFLVTTYKDGEITPTAVTAKEVKALEVSDVDCHIDEAFGPISIRRRTGPRLDYDGHIPGLGEKVGRPFLDELMWRPGEYVSAQELARKPNLGYLIRSGVRATRFRILRKAFGDAASDPWYFLCVRHPWRAAWNAERTWRVIERLA